MAGLLGGYDIPPWLLFGQSQGNSPWPESNRSNAMEGGTPTTGAFDDRWSGVPQALGNGMFDPQGNNFLGMDAYAPRPGFPQPQQMPPPTLSPGATQFAGQPPALGYAPEQPKQQQPLGNFPTSGPLTAPQPTQVSVGAAPPQQSGWDRFGNALNNNAMTLMGFGAGLAGGQGWGEGLSRGLQGAMLGAKSDREQRMLAAAQGSTYQALIARGVPPNMAQAAMLNPKMLELVQKQYFPEFKGEKINDVGYSFNPATGKYEQQAVAPRFDTLSPGQRLVQTTPSIGGMPGASGQVATGGPENAPANYRWKDPNDISKGVEKIPGGPATEVSAENAGKLSLIQASAPGLQKAKEYFLSDKFKSGPVDAAGKVIGQATESFEIGRHRRSIDLATEAALRTATGANAPPPEVKKYAYFYMPSVYDSQATRQQKIQALELFQKYAVQNMGKGLTLATIPPPDFFMNQAGGGKGSDPLGFR